jgi:hypothetical protein
MAYPLQSTLNGALPPVAFPAQNVGQEEFDDIPVPPEVSVLAASVHHPICQTVEQTVPRTVTFENSADPFP